MSHVRAECLVEGDGYRAVLESLDHYIRRLRSMAKDPNSGAGMFGAAISQAAAKRIPVAVQTKKTVTNFLAGGQVPTPDDFQIIQNALECHVSDMEQAASGSKYHADLVGGFSRAKIQYARSLIKN